MKKENTCYIILGALILASRLTVYMVKYYGVVITDALNLFLTVFFTLPIVALLLILGRDKRVGKTWRVLATVGGIFVGICTLVSVCLILFA